MARAKFTHNLAGWSTTRGNLAHPVGHRPRSPGQGRHSRQCRCGRGHHQPARNHRGVEPAHGPAPAPRHRLARPPRRTRLRPARAGPGRHHPGQNRLAGGCLFLRHQAEMDTGPRARRPATGRARRTGLWHGGQLADLATDQRGQVHATDVSNAVTHHAVQRAHQPVG
jgi:hypothetical protein